MTSVRLSPEMRERVRKVAQQKGLTVSEVYRAALHEYLRREEADNHRSRYEDVIGVVDGPGNLSERVAERFTEILADK